MDIFAIYQRYSEIWSRNENVATKEALAELLKLVELRKDTRLVFDDLSKLVPHLDLTVDSCRFTCFYDFVFFMCREKGQKNITVGKAIDAWKFVLKGRFRLLNDWCSFVEKHQKHNIPEDTWQQVLAFSRCVHEDLEGYDPKGAWPVLIDDFVDHMHRVNVSNVSNTHSSSYICDDPEAQACISDDGFPGLLLFSGSKRKLDVQSSYSFLANSMSPEALLTPKRSRQSESTNRSVFWEADLPGNAIAMDEFMERVKHGCSIGSSKTSACAVEGSLLEGFAGLLSTSSCVQLDQKRRVPYTT